MIRFISKTLYKSAKQVKKLSLHLPTVGGVAAEVWGSKAPLDVRYSSLTFETDSFTMQPWLA